MDLEKAPYFLHVDLESRRPRAQASCLEWAEHGSVCYMTVHMRAVMEWRNESSFKVTLARQAVLLRGTSRVGQTMVTGLGLAVLYKGRRLGQ